MGSFLYVHALGAERCPARLTRTKCAFVTELRSSPVTGMVVSPSGYFSGLAQLLLMARRGRVALTAPGARITPIHGPIWRRCASSTSAGARAAPGRSAARRN
ncbi:hypothetical protein [[Pseudopropionibacterium] massiliense]|uniref:hypothetical protein n=1 Tax=[Pseudopropionibacterium] massiliense TaxID=2220000 RepID=UPI001A92C612|nr:hypothetical protein [[Pseudopropionibacterium] massiliense]